jgi:hypothetical protein
VGAPLHETPVPTQARSFVQKLEVGKRHSRDRENGYLAETATAAMANNRRSGREGEDSVEESRVASARVIRKRPRKDSETEETGEAARAVEVVPAKDVVVQEASIVGSVDAATSLNSNKEKKTGEMEMQLLPCSRARARARPGGRNGASSRSESPLANQPGDRRADKAPHNRIQVCTTVHPTPHNCDVSPYRSTHLRFEVP